MRKNAPESNLRYKSMVELYKQGKTQREVAEEFGVSRARVCQVLHRFDVFSGQGGIAVRPKKVYEKKPKPPRVQRICSLEGCDRKYEAKGYCKTHYMRQLLTGDVGGAEIAKYSK